MPKDRLAELHAVQSDHDDDDDDDEDVDEDYVIVNVDETGGYMKDFFNQVKEVREMISNIQNNVKEIKKKHTVLLLAPLNDEETKQELEVLTAELKKNANMISERLKMVEKMKLLNNSSAYLRMHKIQHSGLFKKFLEVMSDYNKADNEHKERLRIRIQRQMKIASRDVTEDEIENMVEQGNTVVLIPGISMLTRKAQQTLTEVEARHADIIKLEASIKELRDLFVEMLMLVEGQGEMIDRIETYVEDVRGRVKTATQDLKKANKH